MRIFQERELIRIADMLKSKDPEMIELGMSLIKRRRIHFNFITIVTFHCFLFLLVITGLVYLSTEYVMGWYMLPAILLVIFQVIGIIGYLAEMMSFRKKYNIQL